MRPWRVRPLLRRQAARCHHRRHHRRHNCRHHDLCRVLLLPLGERERVRQRLEFFWIDRPAMDAAIERLLAKQDDVSGMS